jgi:hypothetical protein
LIIENLLLVNEETRPERFSCVRLAPSVQLPITNFQFPIFNNFQPPVGLVAFALCERTPGRMAASFDIATPLIENRLSKICYW